MMSDRNNNTEGRAAAVGVSAERTTFAEHFSQPELPRAADLLELLDEVDGVDV